MEPLWSSRCSATFFLRRLARIYPPYWLVLLPIAITYFFAAHSLMHAHEGRTDVVSSFLLLPQAHDPLLIVSWTLTFEMFFYAVFALMLKASRTGLLPMLGIWLVAEFTLSATFHGSSNPYGGFLATPLPIEFIIGACVGYAYRTTSMPAAPSLCVAGCVTVALVWIASFTPGLTADLSKNDIWRVLQFGVPAALIVYGAVGLEMRGGSKVYGWIVASGDASYATYLWHVPITIVLGGIATRLHIHGSVEDAVAQFASLAIVLAASLLAYRYFERPVTKMLNRQTTSPTPTS